MRLTGVAHSPGSVPVAPRPLRAVTRWPPSRSWPSTTSRPTASSVSANPTRASPSFGSSRSGRRAVTPCDGSASSRRSCPTPGRSLPTTAPSGRPARATRAAAATLGAAAPPVWVNVAAHRRLPGPLRARRRAPSTTRRSGWASLGAARSSATPSTRRRPVIRAAGTSAACAPCDAVLIVASDDRAACLARTRRARRPRRRGRDGRWCIASTAPTCPVTARARSTSVSATASPCRRCGAGPRRRRRLRGAPRLRRTAAPAPVARPGQALLWPGQVLLGHPRQDPRNPGATIADRSGRTGLERQRLLPRDPQARPGRRRLLALRPSPRPEGGRRPAPLRLAARRPLAVRGAAVPLARTPTTSASPLTTTGSTTSRFGADLDGARCPLAAHIRKVNPRDLATDQGGANDTLTRLFVRRGIPFDESGRRR